MTRFQDITYNKQRPQVPLYFTLPLTVQVLQCFEIYKLRHSPGWSGISKASIRTSTSVNLMSLSVQQQVLPCLKWRLCFSLLSRPATDADLPPSTGFVRLVLSFPPCSGVFMPCSALPTLPSAATGARQLRPWQLHHSQAAHRQHDGKGGSKQSQVSTALF